MQKPEETKNQIVEKIPNKLLNPIIEAITRKNRLSQEFFQISIQLANMQRKYQDVFDKLANNGVSISNKINRAFEKMKLGKRKNIQWRFDGKSAFIGIERPKPKIQEKN